MEFVDKIKKYDKLSIGLIVGLVLPIIGFVLSYFIKTSGIEITFGEYFNKLIGDSPDKMDILIFTMIPNMFLFYFVNFKWKMYEFTKGIVGVTLILGIIVVITGL
jgi:hypothetical protein